MLPSCKVIYCSERTSLFLSPKQRTSKKTHYQFFWVYFNLEFVLGFLRKSEKTGRKKLASRRLIVLWLIISNVSEAGKKPRCSCCCWKYFGLPTAVATRQPVDWRFIETPKSPLAAPTVIEKKIHRPWWNMEFRLGSSDLSYNPAFVLLRNVMCKYIQAPLKTP